MESACAEHPGHVGLGPGGIGVAVWLRGEDGMILQNFSKSPEFPKKIKKLFFGYNTVLRI